MTLHELFLPDPERIEDESDREYWDDRDEVSVVDVTLIPGNGTNYAALTYFDGKWEISLYYPYRISYDVEIGEYQAREVLRDVFGKEPEQVDFQTHDNVYVE